MNFPRIKAIRQRVTCSRSRLTGRLVSIGALLRACGNISRHSTPLGTRGEEIARQYLQRKGFKLIEANWRCPSGEIDLIFVDQGELVFTEVKTRYQTPIARQHLLDNITHAKKRKLCLLVNIYLARKFSRRTRPPVRIDVIGVLLDKRTIKVMSVEHVVAAVGVE